MGFTDSNSVPVLHPRPLAKVSGDTKASSDLPGACGPLWWGGISGSPHGEASRVHQAKHRLSFGFVEGELCIETVMPVRSLFLGENNGHHSQLRLSLLGSPKSLLRKSAPQAQAVQSQLRPTQAMSMARTLLREKMVSVGGAGDGLSTETLAAIPQALSLSDSSLL